MSDSPIEITTGASPVGTVIWMHGLGADGHDFEPLVPELMRLQPMSLRFIFPHAPVRPVTVNGGYPMRAWYDVYGFDRNSKLDMTGIKGSDATIRALIRREQQRGISSERIVLAGFSQGGAMALYSGLRYEHSLAGIMGLSTYLLAPEKLLIERLVVNLHTPVMLVHGTRDPVLPFAIGEQARTALVAAGYAVEWHSYPMEHSLCDEEVLHIAAFLGRIFAIAR
jgi:phospholipase/carboxylesterase